MRRLFAVFLACTLAWPAAWAGPLRDRLAEHRAPRDTGDLSGEADQAGGAFRLPAGTRVLREIAYGTDPAQRFDAYLPARASRAPVLFLVHGGGWAHGDKAVRAVVENKVARWVARGLIVISAN